MDNPDNWQYLLAVIDERTNLRKT